MTSRNIVLIETMDSMGTGFLYPCRYEENFQLQYFIVFTNSHVLQNIGLKEYEPFRDHKGQIRLTFYDSLGCQAEQEDIEKIYVYNSGSMREGEDIAALLVAVKKAVPMNLETGVCHRQPENREVLYLEG